MLRVARSQVVERQVAAGFDPVFNHASDGPVPCLKLCPGRECRNPVRGAKEKIHGRKSFYKTAFREKVMLHKQ